MNYDTAGHNGEANATPYSFHRRHICMLAQAPVNEK